MQIQIAGRMMEMSRVSVDFAKKQGPVKPMHAVNNGPITAGCEQHRANFDAYKAAGFPYARNHDASFCADYGGEHTVDVHAIFPDFSADPYDPASYDFVCTDHYLRSILAAGTQIYYRLGTKIEHGVKKYGTLVPPDFHKWAVICEHIIRHYNEGWADGFWWDIRYWEIWNEPDGIAADGSKPNWAGTPEEFYELYSVAARHLKTCFPEIYVGGPATCGFAEKWMTDMLRYLKKDGTPAPLDFFSFHWYGQYPGNVPEHSQSIRAVLDREGYAHTRIHLNEWNYIEGWTDQFVPSIEAIISMRGAAFTASVMCEGQKSPVDMLMYYDARPSAFNGMFDFYTLRPLKGYYPFVMFSKLYALGTEANGISDDENIRVLAATDGKRHAAMIACYSMDKNRTGSALKLDLQGMGEGRNGEGRKRYYLLDDHNTMAEYALPENGEVYLRSESVLLVTDYDIYD